GLAVEEVGHEDLVLVVLICVGEDVGALEGLWAVAKDVVDNEDCGSSGRGTGSVLLLSRLGGTG
ncbi:MAG: hypothetical protein Q9218_006649, partial [Villophora microphyllina]